MLKSYKYRIYPTDSQQATIDQHMSAVRFIYNLALETKIHIYKRYGKTISGYELINQLPDLKKECQWLKTVYSQSLQSAIFNVEHAFSNFIKGGYGFPKFKRKKSSACYKVNVINKKYSPISFPLNRIKIPKIKKGVKVVIDRVFDGEVKSFFVIKSSTGKYFVSILVADNLSIPHPTTLTDPVVGIDLGLKDFLVSDYGLRVANPKVISKNINRLKALQRRVSRKEINSKNRRKATLRLAKLHEKITNTKNDFLHKLSSDIVNNHNIVVIENLSIRNFMKHPTLAFSFREAGLGEFVRQLKYKCSWRGKKLIIIDRFEPTSKKCSICGWINESLLISDRIWKCSACSTSHDRDLNAAVNIKNSGLGKSVEPVESSTLVGAMKQEYFNY